MFWNHWLAGCEFSEPLRDMHTRRLVKRSILGSRVYAPSPTGDGVPVTGVVQAVKQENRDVSAAGTRRSVYTVLMQDGSLKEFSEEEIASGFNHTAAKGPLKSSLKVCVRKAPRPVAELHCFVVRCFAAFNRFLHGADWAVSPPPLLMANLISWDNTSIMQNTRNTNTNALCIK